MNRCTMATVLCQKAEIPFAFGGPKRNRSFGALDSKRKFEEDSWRKKRNSRVKD